MKLWTTLTGYNPASRVPFSWKALIYAVLCTFLGASCLYCGLQMLLMSGNWLDGGSGQHPYDVLGFGIALLVVMILLCIAMPLWVATVSAAPRKWLNILIAVAVVLVFFLPCLILSAYIGSFGEQIGQLILYGRTHNHDLVSIKKEPFF